MIFHIWKRGFLRVRHLRPGAILPAPNLYDGHTMSTALLKTAQDSAPDPLVAAAELAQRLASTANARDQAGGHAAREREWIRESGLLTLSIPEAYGGQG